MAIIRRPVASAILFLVEFTEKRRGAENAENLEYSLRGKAVEGHRSPRPVGCLNDFLTREASWTAPALWRFARNERFAGAQAALDSSMVKLCHSLP